MAKSLPHVTVLLATYNGAEHIGEQIASIADQADVVVRIVARDDGSRDDTVTRAQSSAAADGVPFEWLEDVDGPSGSAGANFLRLLAGARLDGSDFVAFADQDDVWLPGKLANAIARMRRDEASGYSSNLIATGPAPGERRMVVKSQPPRAFDYLFQSASAGCTYVLDLRAVAAACAPIARAVSIPRFVSHDWYVYAACRAAGLGWTFDPDAHILYRQHRANVEGARTGLSGIRARLRQSRSGWYRGHIAWLAETLDIPSEARKVFADLQRDSFAARLRLVSKVADFRRTRRDRVALAMLILFGWL